MKKLLLFAMLLICGMVTVQAQKPAEIKFDETIHHFGEFSKQNPQQVCKFTFANIGEAHGHGLGLVVGHVDEGGLQALMQLGDLGAHLHA